MYFIPQWAVANRTPLIGGMEGNGVAKGDVFMQALYPKRVQNDSVIFWWVMGGMGIKKGGSKTAAAPVEFTPTPELTGRQGEKITQPSRS